MSAAWNPADPFSTWLSLGRENRLVGGVLPGIERQPRKKLEQRGRAGRGCLIEL